MRVWRQLYDALIDPGSEAVLITVFEAAGSTPCEVGTRMIATSGGAAIGTIGGGMLEWESIGEARESLNGQTRKRSWKSSKLLGPDLAQCCGGAVTLLFEHFSHVDLDAVSGLAAAEDGGPFATNCVIDEQGQVLRNIAAVAAVDGRNQLEVSGPNTFSERFARAGAPLVLFGAGHVGKALARALEPLPFEITWVDSRPEAFPETLPVNAKAIYTPDPPKLCSHAAVNSMVIVMTHSHALDLELVAAALARPSIPYVGLIGSHSKCARFRKRLLDLGITRQAIDRLRCPIGLEGIRSKAPAVIAASITAQLLLFAGSVPGDVTTGSSS